MWRGYLSMAAWLAPVLAVLALALYLPLRKRHRQLHSPATSKAREVWLCLLVVYCAAVAALVLSPAGWYVAHPLAGAWARVQTGQGINMVPLYTIRQLLASKDVGDIANLITNILLLMPLGFLLPGLFARWRRWYRAIPLGLAASMAVETIQLFIGRSVDIDDVLLNTLGAALGYGLWRLTRKRLPGPFR